MKLVYLSFISALFAGSFSLSAEESFEERTQIPAGEWNVLGQGEYYEDVFTMIHWTKSQHWNVTVEESVEKPGWYRFVAYGDGCPEAILKSTIGEPDNESYMYINATDPEHIFMPVSTFGDKYNIASYVYENDFDAERYMTLSNGVISAPDSGVAYQLVTAGDRWQLGNFFEGFKLVLPESSYSDYNFKITTLDDKSCSEDNVFHYTISNVGEDVASFKACARLGYFNGSDEEVQWAYENADFDAAEGENTITATERGRYALIVIAYNAAGEAVATNSSYFYVMDDEADQWVEYGIATYYEDLLGSLYPDMSTEKLSVPIEVHKNRPGYYRLVEPYKDHPYYSSGIYANMYRPHESHKHYLYINAEDPEAVYIEDSPCGVNNGFGDINVLSLAYKYMQDGITKEDAKDLDVFGELDGREITFPENSLVVVERFYKNAVFNVVPATMFRVTLPKTTGINDVIVNADAPVEYFNLQGVKVDNPSNGIFIRRQGSLTEKVILD